MPERKETVERYECEITVKQVVRVETVKGSRGYEEVDYQVQDVRVMTNLLVTDTDIQDLISKVHSHLSVFGGNDVG